jgi:hypothetical protein
MGELVTLKFQKAHNQRVVVLECADFSNYWDTTFQYNFGGSLFGGRRKAAFIGANSNFFTSPLGHGTGTISRLLNGRSVNFPQLRGLLAGVVRMLEAIGGSYYGTNTFRGANDFTSVAELRLKILQQITAAEKDTSTAKLFARKAFNMWMNRATGSLGKLVSFRGLVKICFGFIFHEVYPCPAPKFVPGGSRQSKRRWSVGLSKTKYVGFYDKAKACLDLSVECRQNLTAWRKTKLDGSTSDFQRTDALFLYIRVSKKAQKDSAIVGTEAAKIQHLSAFGQTLLVSAGDKGGSLDRNYDKILNIYLKIENALKRILGIKIGRGKTVTVPTESRVNNQIFRPDIWYAPPPRCNVIFPEMYDSFSFARQYLREVSRLELQTHNEILGKDALFNGRYYAPNVEDVRRGVKLSSRRFARLIMDHELYTGIIPMFENLSEANLFAMRSGKVTKAGAKVSYAQRAVNFQYFKYRFESRSMDCSGRFNPPFVPGFPSLIIDKHMDLVQLHISSLNLEDQARSLGIKGSSTRSELLAELVSPQYLGVCGMLVHDVSQDGGMTRYQLMHARVHRETTEFLGVDKAEVSRVVGEVVKPDVVAAPILSPPKKGQRGPRAGQIVSVRNVSKKYKGRVLRLLGQGSKVKVGDKYPYWYFKGTLTNLELDPETFEVKGLEIGAYEVRESYTRRKKEKVDLPIEEAIRPPWIWDGWANPKISETYDQLFGTGALTDVGGFTVSSNDPSTGTRTFVGEDDVAGLVAQREVETRKSLKGARNRKQKNDARKAAQEEAAKAQNALLQHGRGRFFTGLFLEAGSHHGGHFRWQQFGDQTDIEAGQKGG